MDELQDNFYFLPHFNSKTTEPIVTIFSHDVEQLVMLLMRAIVYFVSEHQSKEQYVNFDVCKNRPKLIGYHSNVPWTTAKLMSVL